MSTQPRVTVLLPVYNALPHLKHTVDSIISQTFVDFKVLAYNDGSTDASGEYLDSITDPRFEVVHQDNAGLAVTLNRMMDNVKTEYIARMDSDDISLPERFEKQVAFLDQHTDAVVVGTRGGYIKGANRTASFGIGKFKRVISYSPPQSNPPYWDPLNDGGIVIHSTVMMRTAPLREVGGYPEIVPGQDLALWHVFSRRGYKLANLDSMLHLSRVCRSGISSANLTKQYHTWRYIGYESDSLAKGLTPVSLNDYIQSHPLSEKELTNLRKRARLRNSLADILEGNLFRGASGIISQIISDPSIVVERVLNRTKS